MFSPERAIDSQVNNKIQGWQHHCTEAQRQNTKKYYHTEFAVTEEFRR